jgi:hypothetical protein
MRKQEEKAKLHLDTAFHNGYRPLGVLSSYVCCVRASSPFGEIPHTLLLPHNTTALFDIAQ